jgi:hypothetical protein
MPINITCIGIGIIIGIIVMMVAYVIYSEAEDLEEIERWNPSKVRTPYDYYERGRMAVLTELMDYTYGMLTTEKFGLQHKIKSMMADRKTENSSEKPNNCETCKYKDHNWWSNKCDPCCRGNSNYEPELNKQQEDDPLDNTDCSWK